MSNYSSISGETHVISRTECVRKVAQEEEGYGGYYGGRQNFYGQEEDLVNTDQEIEGSPEEDYVKMVVKVTAGWWVFSIFNFVRRAKHSSFPVTKVELEQSLRHWKNRRL